MTKPTHHNARQTANWPADSAGISAAAKCLRRGGLAAIPTETVYGLAADARNPQAVAAIFAAKARPTFNPLIVHVADLAAAEALVQLNPLARKAALAFWPGPLTLVLPLRPDVIGHPEGVADLVTAGQGTLAIRIPAHQAAQALLAAFGGPLAAPSANPSGRISPTTTEHVRDGLDGKIDGILDGGPCTVGLESTILGFDPDPVLLRPGGISLEDLTRALGQAPRAFKGDSVTAPGQLASHYAPRGAVRMNATQAKEGEFLIGFGPVGGDITLSAEADLTEAATRLFGALHVADQSGRDIAVAPVPDTGLGTAINDRLRRAAAPRDTA